MNMLWGVDDTTSIKKRRGRWEAAAAASTQKSTCIGRTREEKTSRQRPIRRHSMWFFFFVNEDIRNFDLHQTDATFLCSDSDVVLTTTANDLIWFIESFWLLRFSFGIRAPSLNSLSLARGSADTYAPHLLQLRFIYRNRSVSRPFERSSHSDGVYMDQVIVAGSS